MMLTSVHNERVRAAAALARRDARSKTGRFLLEGPQAVEEALGCRPDLLVEAFVGPSPTPRIRRLAEGIATAGARVESVGDAVLRAIADARHPQGIVAVARQHPAAVERVFEGAPVLVALLARVADPGNAGAVLRVADAAGADGVVLTRGSVDPFNPKVVRATTGSLFHVPFAVGADLAESTALARRAGMTVLAADVSGAELDPEDAAGMLAGPVCWVFGNEAHGLEDDDLALADHVVRLPIYGRAESLNLATAASVLLYQTAFRQRRALARRAAAVPGTGR